MSNATGALADYYYPIVNPPGALNKLFSLDVVDQVFGDANERGIYYANNPTELKNLNGNRTRIIVGALWQDWTGAHEPATYVEATDAVNWANLPYTQWKSQSNT